MITAELEALAFDSARRQLDAPAFDNHLDRQAHLFRIVEVVESRLRDGFGGGGGEKREEGRNRGATVRNPASEPLHAPCIPLMGDKACALWRTPRVSNRAVSLQA